MKASIEYDYMGPTAMDGPLTVATSMTPMHEHHRASTARSDLDEPLTPEGITAPDSMGMILPMTGDTTSSSASSHLHHSYGVLRTGTGMVLMTEPTEYWPGYGPGDVVGLYPESSTSSRTVFVGDRGSGPPLFAGADDVQMMHYSAIAGEDEGGWHQY